ncbi:MAG: FkbM family methyltransferase [Opitutae bacterium]|jgi:FkbM family methyltransferase|nr:FkbM family methyltransferase [Opitutae bacterium]
MPVLSNILKFKSIRQKLLFYLKTHYYREFNISIPLKNGYWAQLLEPDSYDSFSEIFIKEEYKDLLPKETPSKVIDLGSHYGFFSLWLQSIYPESKLKCLLIEPSALCFPSLKALTANEQFNGRFIHLDQVIGDPSEGTSTFYERPFMASSALPNSMDEQSRSAQVLAVENVTQKMPPPYDLIKCDVEGAEWEFLKHYEPIIKASRTLVMEWHSWHSGGGGYPQIRSRLEQLGFTVTKSSDPIEAEGRDGEVGLLQATNQRTVN